MNNSTKMYYFYFLNDNKMDTLSFNQLLKRNNKFQRFIPDQGALFTYIAPQDEILHKQFREIADEESSYSIDEILKDKIRTLGILDQYFPDDEYEIYITNEDESLESPKYMSLDRYIKWKGISFE